MVAGKLNVFQIVTFDGNDFGNLYAFIPIVRFT